jgi:hypothetical protein
VVARPTIKAVSLARCRRRIGSLDWKRDGEEAEAAVEAVGGARRWRRHCDGRQISADGGGGAPRPSLGFWGWKIYHCQP